MDPRPSCSDRWRFQKLELQPLRRAREKKDQTEAATSMELRFNMLIRGRALLTYYEYDGLLSTEDDGHKS